jgi:hypothetical protein
MFSAFYKTKLEWRRVAVYQPVNVSGVTLVNEDGSERQHVLQTCHAGMRVGLRREPTRNRPNGIAVFVNEGRQIGYLAADVAEWAAPALDSGRVEFDAEIWSLEKIADDQGQEMFVCRLMLTQHELVPVKRFSWTAWLRGGRRSPAKVTVR